VAYPDKTPDELIAEFHAVSGVKPGTVTYEGSNIVFRYPSTGMSEDRMSLAMLQVIIDRERQILGIQSCSGMSASDRAQQARAPGANAPAFTGV
jgi:hypothetical protein